MAIGFQGIMPLNGVFITLQARRQEVEPQRLWHRRR